MENLELLETIDEIVNIADAAGLDSEAVSTFLREQYNKKIEKENSMKEIVEKLNNTYSGKYFNIKNFYCGFKFFKVAKFIDGGRGSIEVIGKTLSCSPTLKVGDKTMSYYANESHSFNELTSKKLTLENAETILDSILVEPQRVEKEIKSLLHYFELVKNSFLNN